MAEIAAGMSFSSNEPLIWISTRHLDTLSRTASVSFLVSSILFANA